MKSPAYCLGLNLGMRRTPHGVRGLKYLLRLLRLPLLGRTPHGVRGLKCACLPECHSCPVVAPLTGCVD